MKELLKSRVLVMGGSSGIGLATAQAAARAGAEVTLVARDPAKLTVAAATLAQGGAMATLDLRDPAAVDTFFISRPPWNHVVVSASQTPTGPVRGLDLAGAYEAMQSKFWGAYHVGRACRIVPGGSLTLLSGVFSVRPNKNAVLQGAINAALEGLARGLALELAPVRVNVVSPSVTDTPLWSKLASEDRQDKFKDFATRIPTGRIAWPEDIAHAILFLATNPFATGSTLLIDGGDALV